MLRHARLFKLLILDMLIIEFGPLLVFFALYHFLCSFGKAALGLAGTTLVTLYISKLVNQRIPWFVVISGGITAGSAILSYWFKTPDILIFTDTVFYFLFAGLLASGVFHKRQVFATFFSHVFCISEAGWKILERRFLGIFIAAGIANELVRHLGSVHDWVVFKQWLVVVFLLFGFYQLRVTSSHRTEEADRFGLRSQEFRERIVIEVDDKTHPHSKCD
ncbi:septation protein IspZ [Candidatus Kaiserbacteria bacterium]|nr:septation protein IspZ [Candidatus Kaiserbacteria bacterium]